MAVDKQKRDDKLDQLGLALDARLAQWQVTINEFSSICDKDLSVLLMLV